MNTTTVDNKEIWARAEKIWNNLSPSEREIYLKDVVGYKSWETRDLLINKTLYSLHPYARINIVAWLWTHPPSIMRETNSR